MNEHGHDPGITRRWRDLRALASKIAALPDDACTCDTGPLVDEAKAFCRRWFPAGGTPHDPARMAAKDDYITSLLSDLGAMAAVLKQIRPHTEWAVRDGQVVRVTDRPVGAVTMEEALERAGYCHAATAIVRTLTAVEFAAGLDRQASGSAPETDVPTPQDAATITCPICKGRGGRRDGTPCDEWDDCETCAGKGTLDPAATIERLARERDEAIGDVLGTPSAATVRQECIDAVQALADAEAARASARRAMGSDDGLAQQFDSESQQYLTAIAAIRSHVLPAVPTADAPRKASAAGPGRRASGGPAPDGVGVVSAGGWICACGPGTIEHRAAVARCMCCGCTRPASVGKVPT
jgi:hypothetical protein